MLIHELSCLRELSVFKSNKKYNSPSIHDKLQLNLNALILYCSWCKKAMSSGLHREQHLKFSNTHSKVKKTAIRSKN